MNKLTKSIFSAVIGLSFVVAPALPAMAVAPADFGLTEGDVIRAEGDIDVYIVNEHGYKRLFVNPAIFNIYGHLGFNKVKTVTPTVRDAFKTSGLFRNCETNDQKVYGLEVVSEDVANLHWVNTTGAQAAAADPDFFKKVFCINNNEQALYGVGTPYTSVSQIPDYSRFGGAVAQDVAVIASNNLAGQTIPAGAKGVAMLSVDFKGTGSVDKLTLNRLGFLSDTYYDGVYLAVNGKRITDPVTFSGIDNKEIKFINLGLVAPFNLVVAVDFEGAIPTGTPAQVSLAGSYNGLPLQSNSFLFATISPASSITLQSSVAVDDVVVGQVNAKVGEFKFFVPSGAESVTVKSIVFENDGNADVANVKAVVDGVSYPATYLGDDKYKVSTNFSILDGKTKKVEVFADVSTSADAGDTIHMKVRHTYDVVAIGNVFGFGVAVNGIPFELDVISVAGVGELSVKALTTGGDKSAAWGDDVLLAKYEFEAGEEEGFYLDTLTFNNLDEDNFEGVSLKVNGTAVGSESVDGSTATVSFDSTVHVLKDGVVSVEVWGELTDDEYSTRLSDYKVHLSNVEATGDSSDEEISVPVSVDAKYGLSTYGSVLTLPVGTTSMVVGDELALTLSFDGNATAALTSTSHVLFSASVTRHATLPGNTLFRDITWTAYLDGEEVASGTWATLVNNSNSRVIDVDFSDVDFETTEFSDGDSAELTIVFDGDIEDFNYSDGDRITVTLDSVTYTDDFEGDNEDEVTVSPTDDLKWKFND